MEKLKDIFRVLITNLAVMQVQAIVLGFIAGTATALTVVGNSGEVLIIVLYFQNTYSMTTLQMHIDRVFLIVSTSITTASFASFGLGSLMIMLITIAHRNRINPDNIATPIAASLGDITTLGLLALIGSVHLLIRQSSFPLLNALIVVLFLDIIPIAMFLSTKESTAFDVLKHGWYAVISALIISRYYY